jgi:phospholipid/cholesterol/gamma-HCH transport system permease protein
MEPTQQAPTEHAGSTRSRPEALLSALGRTPTLLAREVAANYRLLLRTVYFLARGRREKGAVARQMFEIGNRSAFFMTVTMGVIGVILVFQSGLQAKKIVPDLSLLGATYTKFLVRDFAASIGAMPLATRVGAGIAAEIGSMVVTEQVDALRMSSADPVDYLVVPRFVASVVMSVVVLVWGCGVAFVTGMWAANAVFDINPHTFADLSLVSYGDVIVGLVKCGCYGAAIAIVSSHRGLVTHGGSAGVGWATTTAVVHSCFAIIVLNFFISALSVYVLPP